MQSKEAPAVNQLYHTCGSYSPLDTRWKGTTKGDMARWRNRIILQTGIRQTGRTQIFLRNVSTSHT